MNNGKEEYLYFNLPMWPITSYFFGGLATRRKYKNIYLCGPWYKHYSYNGNSEAIIPKSSFTKYGRKFISLLEKNDEDFSNFLYEKYTQIISLADKLQKINSDEICNGKIPKRDSFLKEYEKIFPYVIGIGYSIDTTLEDYIKEKNIDLSKVTIPGESFVIKEEKSLQKVARGEKSLEQHTCDFSFIFSNYVGYHPVPLSYFKERLENVRNKKFKKITKLKKPQTMEEWIGFSTYIRDERKRCNMLFSALYMRYIERECKKHQLDIKTAVMLTPPEFEKTKRNKTFKNYKEQRICKTSHRGGYIDIPISQWNDIKEEIQKKEIKGIIASKGKVSGKVCIVMNKNDFPKVKKGNIIVTSMTRPEFIPILKDAAGIITNEGGITCHAAIISRELNIPCIIGTQTATQNLKDGDIIELDANKGIIKIKKDR